MPIKGFTPGDVLVSESAVRRLQGYEDSVAAMRPVLDSIRTELLIMYQQALSDQASDDSLRRANQRLQDSLHWVRTQRRDTLMNGILDALSEAADNESLMYRSLSEVERRSKQARRHRRRTGRKTLGRWIHERKDTFYIFGGIMAFMVGFGIGQNGN